MVLALALVICHVFVAAAITIPLAASTSLTGPFVSVGTMMKKSIDMYQEMVAAKAAELAISPPVEFEIAVRDDRSSADGVVAAYSNMTNDGLEYFIGPFTSEMTATALNTLINKTGTDHVLLAPSSSGGTALLSSNSAFGISQRASTWLIDTLTSLKRLGAHTVMMVALEYTASLDTCSLNVSALNMQLARPLLQLPTTNTPLAESQAVAAILSNISMYEPDVVVFCTRVSILQGTFKAAQMENIAAKANVIVAQLDVPGAATDALLNQGLALEAVPWAPRNYIVEGAVPSDLSCTWLGCISPQQFADLFKARWGVPATTEAASTFASLEVYEQAFRVALETGSPTPAVISNILANGRFDTVYGRISFSPASRMNVARSFTRQLQQGTLQIVLPSYAATSTIQYPLLPWYQQDCLTQERCAAHGQCNALGTCTCDLLYTDSRCSVSVGVILFVFICIIGAAALAFLAVLFQRRSSRHKAAMELAALQAKRDAMDAVARDAHQRLLGYATHEIANPLFAITAVTEEAISTIPEGTTVPAVEVAIEDLTAVHSAAQQIRRVLQEMAAHGKGRISGVVEEQTLVDLRHVLRDVAHRVRRVHDVTCTVDISPSLPTAILVDPLHFYELCFNLCLHMATHTAAPVRLAIRLDYAVTGLEHNDLGEEERKEGQDDGRKRGQSVPGSSPIPPLAARPPSLGLQLSGDLPIEAPDSIQVEPYNIDENHRSPSFSSNPDPSRRFLGTLTLTCSVVHISDHQSVDSQHSSTNTPSSTGSVPSWVREHSKLAVWQHCTSLVQQMHGTMEHDCEGTAVTVATVHLAVSSGASTRALSEREHAPLEISPQSPPVNGVANPLAAAADTVVTENKPGLAASDSLRATNPRAAVEGEMLLLGAGAVSPASAAAASTVANVQQNVLIIEDDTTNSRLVTRMVAKAGWKSQALFDGADLPSVLAKHPTLAPFWCVLLDIVMPRSDGVEVCKKIRHLGYHGLLVAMTANTHADDVVRYHAAGFDMVLGKPFNFADITRVLNAATATGQKTGQT